MGNLFSNIYVSRGDGYRKVPITVSSKEHFVASLNSQELNGDGSVANVATLLPRIGLDMVSCTYDATRKTNIANRKLTRDFTGDRPKSNKLFNPVPYDFEFEVSVYTRHQDDAFQIIEQILPYFQPQFNTMIKELDENEVVVDQRDIPIILESAVPETTFEGAAGDMRHIEWTLNLRMKGWLYPPTNAQFGEIRTIYLNFQDEEQTIIHAEREAVTSSYDILWKVRSEVEALTTFGWRHSVDSLYGLVWNTRGDIVSDLEIDWNRRFSITDALQIDWSTRSSASSELLVDWNIRDVVGRDYDVDWYNRQIIESTYDSPWGVSPIASNELAIDWDTREFVELNTDIQWSEGAIAESSLDVVWNRSQYVEAVSDIDWSTRAVVTSVNDIDWSTRSELSASTDINYNMSSQVTSSYEMYYLPGELAWNFTDVTYNIEN
ncbi:UNVERIFIED_ORG: hypothetical protein GCAPEGMB_00019 [Vibrio phage V07]